jgi:hypothetical protein
LLRTLEDKKYENRWEENIREDLKEEWIQFLQDMVEWWALVNRVIDLPFHTHKQIKSPDHLSKCQFLEKL